MKLPPGLVGTGAGPRVHEIDARWLMAYAACLGETASAYLDTTRTGGVVAHPLFPVCYEWPLALDLRERAMGDEIAVRSVHATHDLVIHRPPRAGDRLSTTAVVTRVEPRRPGAYVCTRFQTVDAGGQPVSTTDYGSLYRGVQCDTAPSMRDGVPNGATAGDDASPPPDWSARVAVAPTLAHVYSECARIWNPIHTDRAVARAAGLPDIILHGTATLALAVSEIQRRLAPGCSIARIACRFSAPVGLPSTITVQGWATRETPEGPTLRFQALNAEGRAAVTRGRIVLARRAQEGREHR